MIVHSIKNIMICYYILIMEKGKIKEFILDYASDLNESTVMEDLEITTNEFVSSLNEG